MVPKLNGTVTPKLNSMQRVMYPIYDSDMIDNIGHRSRVLMYLKDESTSEKSEVEVKSEKNTETVTGKAMFLFYF